MSRGLGRIEQAVLAQLRASQEPYTWLSALQAAISTTHPSPPVSPERRFTLLVTGGIITWRDPRLEAVNRAVRRLARKGLVRTGKDRWGRAHRKAVWLAEREGPGLQEQERFR
jgi:hypothetical protein